MLTIAGRADEALLDAFYAELYLPAFAHQREPLEAWKRRLWDDPGGLEVAITVAGEDLSGAPRLAGGVVAEHYPRSNTGFLTYLVVAPDARRAGLGRGLLERARDARDARCHPRARRARASLTPLSSRRIRHATMRRDDPG